MEASAVPLSISGLSVSSPAALDASVAVSRTVCRCNHHLLRISPTPALLPRLRKGAVNYSSAKCPLSADTIIGIQLWTMAGWMGSLTPRLSYLLLGESHPPTSYHQEGM